MGTGAGRIAAGLGVVAGLLTACAGPTATRTPAQRSGPAAEAGQSHVRPSACNPNSMLVLAGDWNGSAGGSSGFITITNAGHTTCVLPGGYPQVRLLGRSGQTLATASDDAVPFPHSSFVLPPGSSVGTRVSMSDPSNIPAAVCGPATATAMGITAPSGSPDAYVQQTFQVCTKTSTVAVQPLQPMAGLTGF
jgi:hypothetical protein